MFYSVKYDVFVFKMTAFVDVPGGSQATKEQPVHGAILPSYGKVFF